MKIDKKHQKNNALREALKKHGIGWRDFVRYGYVNVDIKTGESIFGMGKHRNQYDYYICTIGENNEK